MSATAGRAAGGFVGGIANNPGIVAIAGIAITVISLLLIFRKDISGFFEGFGKIELPEFPTIEFPEFPDINIEFPDITFPEFPEFPDFGSIFDDFFNQFFGGDGGPVDIVPGPTDGDGGVTFPPGCTVDPATGIIECETPPTFDVCDDFPELCEPCGPGEERIGGICRPIADQDPIGGGTGEEPPSGPELPGGFEGGGPSFEGGIIFETPDCNLSLSQLIDKYGITASQAANLKFEQCEESDFDFGTNTGAGGTPTTEESGIVTGGATPESEAQRAACTSCELFGLNCPICAGEQGA